MGNWCVHLRVLSSNLFRCMHSTALDMQQNQGVLYLDMHHHRGVLHCFYGSTTAYWHRLAGASAAFGEASESPLIQNFDNRKKERTTPRGKVSLPDGAVAYMLHRWPFKFGPWPALPLALASKGIMMCS